MECDHPQDVVFCPRCAEKLDVSVEKVRELMSCDGTELYYQICCDVCSDVIWLSWQVNLSLSSHCYFNPEYEYPSLCKPIDYHLVKS